MPGKNGIYAGDLGLLKSTFKNYALFHLLVCVDLHASPILPQGVFQISGTATNLPHSDLKPFGEMIGDRTLVALGESIHTSGGFYDLKIRAIRYLVEEKGFRAFGIESPWSTAEVAENFVAGQQISVDAAMASLFPVWDHKGLADLLVWLREWNHKHSDDQIVFFGFDEQQAPDDFKIIKEYLKQRDIIDQNLENALFACQGVKFDPLYLYYQTDEYRYLQKGNPVNKTYFDLTNWSLDHLRKILDEDQQKDNLYWRASTALISLAAFHYSMLQGGYSGSEQKQKDYSETRDEAMAKIALLQWGRLAPGKKLILWAHNIHIESVPATSSLLGPIKNMGFHLFQSQKDNYFPVLLLAGKMEIDWKDLNPLVPVVPKSLNHIEYILSLYQMPYLLVDARSHTVFKKDHLYQWGGQYEFRQNVQAANSGKIENACSAFFYLEKSPAMIRTYSKK